jgi:hypothetical protein
MGLWLAQGPGLWLDEQKAQALSEKRYSSWSKLASRQFKQKEKENSLALTQL